MGVVAPKGVRSCGEKGSGQPKGMRRGGSMGASSVPGCCVLKIWMSGRLLYCVPRDMTGAMLSFDTRKIPETRAAHRGPAFRCGSSRPPCGKKEKGLEEEKCPNKRSDGD
jgi:hypothetical protein